MNKFKSSIGKTTTTTTTLEISFMKRRAPHSLQDKRNCIELEFKQRQIVEHANDSIRASRIVRRWIYIKYVYLYATDGDIYWKLTVAARRAHHKIVYILFIGRHIV